jgi:MarR family transcriptional repressor of emrRAB
VAHVTARHANLLGALSLAVADRLADATTAGATFGASAPAALVALAEYLDGATVDALRRVLGLTHSGAVRLVDRLSAAGLLERGPAPDGRAVALHLTPKGRRTVQDVLAAREHALAAVLAPLAPAERTTLAALHERLLSGLTPDRATARRLCRLCDGTACGHPQGRCPVTRAADDAA